MRIAAYMCALLALSLGGALARGPINLAHAKGFDLLQLIMQTQSNSRLSAETQACFDYYNPVLVAISAEYEASYVTCENVADESRAEIDKSTVEKREEIERDVDQSYEELNKCKENANSVLYFECYENAAAFGTKVLYGVSLSAADILVTIREQYRVVEFEEGRCKDRADRAYVSKWSSTFDDLQSCLAGQSTPPTPTQSTEPTTAEPTTESTEAPVTTTEAPAPTTEAPEDSESEEKSGLPEEDISSESNDDSDSFEKRALRRRSVRQLRRL